MYVLGFCICVVLVGSSYAAFSWEECSAIPERAAAVVDSLTVSPSPIRIPGPVSVGLTGRILRPADNVDMRMVMEKNMGWLGWFPSQCTRGWGTCTHDACTLFGNARNGTFAGEVSAGLARHGLNLSCPIAQQNIQVDRITVNFPRLPPSLQALATVGICAGGRALVDIKSNSFCIGRKELPLIGECHWTN